MTGGGQEASAAIAEGVDVVSGWNYAIGRERHTEGLNQQVVAGKNARGERGVKVQKRDHGSRRRQSKFNIEFGQYEHRVVHFELQFVDARLFLAFSDRWVFLLHRAFYFRLFCGRA